MLQVDIAQRLEQLLLLAAHAQFGDRAEDVGEGAPLRLGVDVAPDLQGVPAERPHGVRPELQDVDVPLQARGVEQLPPAGAEVQHHRAGMPFQRALVSHADRRHRFAPAGIAGEQGVHQAVGVQAHRGGGQVGGFGRVLVAEQHVAGHGRVKAHALGDRRHHRHRRAFFEQARRGVGGQLPGGEQGGVFGEQVAAQRVGGLLAGVVQEGQGVIAHVLGVLAGWLQGQHRGGHARTVEGLRHQCPGSRFPAGLAVKQQGVGHEGALG